MENERWYNGAMSKLFSMKYLITSYNIANIKSWRNVFQKWWPLSDDSMLCPDISEILIIDAKEDWRVKKPFQRHIETRPEIFYFLNFRFLLN